MTKTMVMTTMMTLMMMTMTFSVGVQLMLRRVMKFLRGSAASLRREGLIQSADRLLAPKELIKAIRLCDTASCATWSAIQRSAPQNETPPAYPGPKTRSGTGICIGHTALLCSEGILV